MKPLRWVSSANEDIREFPREVRKEFGLALQLAQVGQKSFHAKPLKGFAGAGVLEVLSDYDGDAYRAVYTVRLEDAVYVLHAFKKKSKSGIATPKHEVAMVRSRLKLAEADHAARRKTTKE